MKIADAIRREFPKATDAQIERVIAALPVRRLSYSQAFDAERVKRSDENYIKMLDETAAHALASELHLVAHAIDGPGGEPLRRFECFVFERETEFSQQLDAAFSAGRTGQARRP